jgi:hypothetical protein
VVCDQQQPRRARRPEVEQQRPQHPALGEVQRRPGRLGGGRDLARHVGVDLAAQVHHDEVRGELPRLLAPGVAVAAEPCPQRVVVVRQRTQCRGQRRPVDLGRQFE